MRATVVDASGPPARVPFVDGTVATYRQANVASSPALEREIMAAIELVAGGVAVRVSVIGCHLPVEVAHQAVRMAQTAGCVATIRTGEGGRLGLVVSSRHVTHD